MVDRTRVPLNADQVVAFGIARRAYGRDRLALTLTWLCTLGFLAIGITGRIVSLAIATGGLAVALPWTTAVVRRRRDARQIQRTLTP